MNFGTFAGGFSQGFDNGVRMGKTVRDIIRERKLEELRQQGLEEARTAREAAVNGIITDKPPAPPEPGKAADPRTQPEAVTPDTGPAPTQAPAQAPTASPDAVAAKTAAAAMPPSVSTQAPAQPPEVGVNADGNAGEAEARANMAKGMQNPAATGMPGLSKPEDRMISPSDPGNPTGDKQEAGQFWVSGKAYATRDAAYKAAEAATPTTMDFFMKNAVPKLQEEYIAQGDPAKAEAWGQWSQQRQNQATMKEWASMYRAAQFGDMEKAADHAFNLYKKLDDGITPLSKETVKDKDGTITGFNVRLKNDATGEVTSQFIDKRALIEMGLQGLAPDKMFEMTFRRQADADKAAMEARIKRGEKAAEFQEKVVLQDRNNQQRAEIEGQKGRQRLSEISLKEQLESANLGAKERAKVDANIGVLKDYGYNENEIKPLLPSLLKVDQYRKGASPDESRRMFKMEILKNDPSFSKKSVEDQNAIIDKLMSDGKSAPASSSSGAPAQGKVESQVPVYVREKTTGQIYVKKGEQLIPVNPRPAGPAGGVPAR